MARTGEQYQLTCTVTSSAGNVPSIVWMNSGEVIASNTSGTYLGMTVTNGITSSSVLLLTPLSVEHSGNYTCQATIVSMTYSYTYPVLVVASELIKQCVALISNYVRARVEQHVLCIVLYPLNTCVISATNFFSLSGQLTLLITVSPPGVIRQASSSINLTCAVSGTFYPPLSYQWTSTCSGNCFVLLGSAATLSESTLHSIDSGNHTCTVTDSLGNSGTATTEVVVAGKQDKK